MGDLVNIITNPVEVCVCPRQRFTVNGWPWLCPHSGTLQSAGAKVSADRKPPRARQLLELVILGVVKTNRLHMWALPVLRPAAGLRPAHAGGLVRRAAERRG